jgi:hypothetical protein
MIESLPPPKHRNPFLTFLMVILGIILLLPGVCALVFIVAMGSPSLGGGDSGLLALWLVCFVIAFGGAMLIRQAFR